MVTNFSEDGMKGTQWLHAQKKKTPKPSPVYWGESQKDLSSKVCGSTHTLDLGHHSDLGQLS